MINAGHLAALAASWCSGTLLLVGTGLAKLRQTTQCVAARGYTVDAVGITEALWCWPVDGYDLVLIDATERPSDGVELCEYIKQSRPRQKVAMLVGQRSGQVPFRLNADAILSGEPDGLELVRAVDFLIRDGGSSVRF